MGFGERPLLCQHLLNPTADSWLCVPLMTKGEALGVYHLRFERQESRAIGPRRGVHELAQAVADISHWRSAICNCGKRCASSPRAIR